MEECNQDWVEFFIETINVYNEEKIPIKDCDVSAAVTLTFSLLAVLVLVFVSLY